MVSEKVGGAEGTKLDDDFRDLERVRETSFCGLKRETSLALGPGWFYTQYTNTSIISVGLPLLMFIPHLTHYIILCWFKKFLTSKFDTL